MTANGRQQWMLCKIAPDTWRTRLAKIAFISMSLLIFKWNSCYFASPFFLRCNKVVRFHWRMRHTMDGKLHWFHRLCANGIDFHDFRWIAAEPLPFLRKWCYPNNRKYSELPVISLFRNTDDGVQSRCSCKNAAFSGNSISMHGIPYFCDRVQIIWRGVNVQVCAPKQRITGISRLNFYS